PLLTGLKLPAQAGNFCMQPHGVDLVLTREVGNDELSHRKGLAQKDPKKKKSYSHEIAVACARRRKQEVSAGGKAVVGLMSGTPHGNGAKKNLPVLRPAGI
ncbi:MAG: hypothetical protein VX633_12795, partial [Verrucomicrobiota bacterium]|nr:hypothetical protein [Verrucomicrobiota bacterium]